MKSPGQDISKTLQPTHLNWYVSLGGCNWIFLITFGAWARQLQCERNIHPTASKAQNSTKSLWKTFFWVKSLWPWIIYAYVQTTQWRCVRPSIPLTKDAFSCITPCLQYHGFLHCLPRKLFWLVPSQIFGTIVVMVCSGAAISIFLDAFGGSVAVTRRSGALSPFTPHPALFRALAEKRWSKRCMPWQLLASGIWRSSFDFSARMSLSYAAPTVLASDGSMRIADPGGICSSHSKG